MAIGEESQPFIEQLVEHPPLILRDDAGADAREHDRLAVARGALEGEQHDDDQGKRHDAGKITVHIGLVDHVAQDIGAERRAYRRHRHEDEGDRIKPPVNDRVLGQQTAHQGGGAVAVTKQ